MLAFTPELFLSPTRLHERSTGSTVPMDVTVREGAPLMNPKVSTATPRIRRLTRPGTLAADLPEWDGSALAARASTPMQTRAWIRACAETIPTALRIVVIEDDQGVAAVAPLVHSTGMLPVDELLGVRELGEPSDFLYRSDEGLATLLREVARGRTPLVLERVLAAAPTVEVVRRVFRGSGIVIVRPANNCPHVALTPAGKDPDQLLSSRLRSDLRRAQRKAESQGKVTYELHAPRTAEEFQPLYDQALQVEAAGWKGRGGSAVAKNELQRAFFNRYGVLASEAGVLRIAFLKVDGVLAAMQYAVEWNGGFWLLKVGYDETYSKCSPGQLLMQHTLRYACERGLASYEFLGSAETWTQRWTTAEQATVRISVYPFGPVGMLTLARDILRALRRKVGARLAARRQTKPQPELAEAAGSGAAPERPEPATTRADQ